ncbi:protein disulfide-isomerase A4-like isoform X2 [Pomacea canaliculata]|uniref:protein disulfide-isomerase A4-like isoform X2 n=1 Tax=Pomacea canaliculata TaxID=400727 RepID=UPI000D729136|nr:protein disulfide-isomerase A4-like isoform X2 [Pomacea canaliculata]
MKVSKFLVSLFLAGLLLVAFVSCDNEDDDEDTEDDNDADEDGDDDGVLVLTKDNFSDFIKDTDTALVEFYAPWCGHCKSLAPVYAAAAKELKVSDPPVILAKVDATVETDLAQQYDVTGYPTLKFFKRGSSYDYDGGRDKTGIVNFMKVIASPDWKPEPEAVVVLTQENFTEVVSREELMLVEFYAPWCGHCKQLAPKYEKAAKQLRQSEYPIILAKVDATVETDLAAQYGVNGYPTLKVFRKGRQFDYKGQRETYDIISYMESQRGDPAKPVVGLKALKAFLKEDDINVLGIFDSETDPRLQTFQDSLQDIREEYRSGFTTDETIKNHYKANSGSVLVIIPERYYTSYEPKWKVFEIKEDTKPDEITKFIVDNEFPLVGSMDSNNQARYAKRSPLCLFFYDVDWGFDHREATQMWRKKIASIAKDFRNITFAVADEEKNMQMLKELGLEDSSEEINIGILANGKKYPMEPMEEFDPDEVREFLNQFLKGKVEPHIKSQPVPKKQEGPVTIVVGKSFDKIVKDTSKDVLIELYAPWCGHCKKLEPVYKDLAKKLKSVKNLVIAKMDATANDVPYNYPAEGFPTIYFAPTNNKDKPLKYEGGRELKDFISFLKEKATVSLGKIKMNCDCTGLFFFFK